MPPPAPSTPTPLQQWASDHKDVINLVIAFVAVIGTLATVIGTAVTTSLANNANTLVQRQTAVVVAQQRPILSYRLEYEPLPAPPSQRAVGGRRDSDFVRRIHVQGGGGPTLDLKVSVMSLLVLRLDPNTSKELYVELPLTQHYGRPRMTGQATGDLAVIDANFNLSSWRAFRGKMQLFGLKSGLFKNVYASTITCLGTMYTDSIGDVYKRPKCMNDAGEFELGSRIDQAWKDHRKGLCGEAVDIITTPPEVIVKLIAQLKEKDEWLPDVAVSLPGHEPARAWCPR